jgi:hydrogenase maturation protein HypF
MPAPALRRLIRVEGGVQGVGFRPFVHRLAVRHGLSGFVRNETGGVRIEVEGDGRSLEGFLSALEELPPPGSRISDLRTEDLPVLGETTFSIESSRLDPRAEARVSPDLPTCESCLRELFDSRDRRYRYPFIACAGCGPRFTIVTAVPYDRERTSMDRFPLCGPCRSEYEDPGDRRFHAEGTACAACGPKVGLKSGAGTAVDVPDPLAEAGRQILDGRIVAVKGLGGYHLACDARREETVRELRRRKGRDEKPFALMVADVAAARRLCDVSPAEEALLGGPERPIVLLHRRDGETVAPGIVPAHPTLGIMLPYTPVHHLLLAAVGGTPLVMTSGNASDEPIAFEDEAALRELGGIADLLLVHDRKIVLRCDDSVARVSGGLSQVHRRSRGHAPATVELSFRCQKRLLAMGGAYKSTFALGRGPEAILSHHLGDLESYSAIRAYEAAIRHYESLFRFSPEVVAHDLHPDYPTTRIAIERGLPRVAVQHHHAHMVACMVENGLTGPAIGVTFDGTGYGLDGTIWGGEFLVGDARAVRRAAHLEAVPMPGGEAAIHEPWRMAVAYLDFAGEALDLLGGRIGDREIRAIRRQVDRRLNAPLTSSVGRLFDGVSSILGLRDRVSYEGQAAIELEGLARGSSARGAYPVEVAADGAVRLSPILCALAGEIRGGRSPADIARRFHTTIVEAIRIVCGRIRGESGLDRVVLSGGVFMNDLLNAEVPRVLAREGFRVFRHRRVPPNDGGLCLGQLAVAAAGEGA